MREPAPTSQNLVYVITYYALFFLPLPSLPSPFFFFLFSLPFFSLFLSPSNLTDAFIHVSFCPFYSQELFQKYSDFIFNYRKKIK